MSEPNWLLPDAAKDAQSITRDWTLTGVQLIDGVLVREVRNVPKNGGHLTEIFRRDWFDRDQDVGHVFSVTLEPGTVSAWHAHASSRDRLFVDSGMVQIALYDAREGSPTFGVLNTFRFGALRPALVVVPPRIWHGIQNVGSTVASVLNLVDVAYRYEDPDHWRIPADSPHIPFSWSSRRGI